MSLAVYGDSSEGAPRVARAGLPPLDHKGWRRARREPHTELLWPRYDPIKCHGGVGYLVLRTGPRSNGADGASWWFTHRDARTRIMGSICLLARSHHAHTQATSHGLGHMADRESLSLSAGELPPPPAIDEQHVGLPSTPYVSEIVIMSDSEPEATSDDELDDADRIKEEMMQLLHVHTPADTVTATTSTSTSTTAALNMSAAAALASRSPSNAHLSQHNTPHRTGHSTPLLSDPSLVPHNAVPHLSVWYVAATNTSRHRIAMLMICASQGTTFACT